MLADLEGILRTVTSACAFLQSLSSARIVSRGLLLCILMLLHKLYKAVASYQMQEEKQFFHSCVKYQSSFLGIAVGAVLLLQRAVLNMPIPCN